MSDAEKAGMFELNEWQLGIDKTYTEQHEDEVNIAFQMGAEWQRDRYKKRIEQLEAALREIAALGFWDGDRAMDIAHTALEGKKDA